MFEWDFPLAFMIITDLILASYDKHIQLLYQEINVESFEKV